MTIINKQQIVKIEVVDSSVVKNYVFEKYEKPSLFNLWKGIEEGYYPKSEFIGDFISRQDIVKSNKFFELNNVLYYYPKVKVTYINGDIETFYRPSIDSAKELANSLGFGVNFYNIT